MSVPLSPAVLWPPAWGYSWSLHVAWLYSILPATDVALCISGTAQVHQHQLLPTVSQQQVARLQGGRGSEQMECMSAPPPPSHLCEQWPHCCSCAWLTTPHTETGTAAISSPLPGEGRSSVLALSGSAAIHSAWRKNCSKDCKPAKCTVPCRMGRGGTHSSAHCHRGL